MFPPASLPPAEALAEDARATASAHAFMLARLVWPASRSASVSSSERAISVGSRRAAPGGTRASRRSRRGTATISRRSSGSRGEVYVEVPLDDALEERLDALAAHGLRAKVRCGGAEVPTSRTSSRVRPRVPRARARVQGDRGPPPRRPHERRARLPQPPRGAVFAGDGGSGARRDRSAAFGSTRRRFAWRDRSASADELARARRDALHSIGSCSFFEPVEELEALGSAARCERRRRLRCLLRRRRRRRASASASATGSSTSRRAASAPSSRRTTLNPFLALGRASWEDTLARVDELVDGRRRARPARGRDARTCRSRSPTTSTSTRRSSTRRTSGGSSVRTPSRCCRTGATFRSATTAAPGPSSSAARRSCARAARRRRRRTMRRASGRAGGSTSSSSSASSSESAARSASPCRTSAFRDHVFGVVLVNDWSARDIQAWEYQPLGPFLGKSFATSIAAWVTPLALLEDRFVSAPEQDPEPLAVPAHRRATGRSTSSSRSSSPARSSRARTRAASTGRCRSSSPTRRSTAPRSGPATCSRRGRSPAPSAGSEGSLIELTWNGERPVRLADGSSERSSRTATRSCCAAAPASSSSARCAGRSCRARLRAGTMPAR